MKRAILSTFLFAGVAAGQFQLGGSGGYPGRLDEQRIPAEKVKYIAIMQVRVPDYSSSYAMVCSSERPDCNTVYTMEYQYVPFATAEDAIDYLNATPNTFVRLLVVQTASVKKSETVTIEKQPDIKHTTVHYSLAK